MNEIPHFIKYGFWRKHSTVLLVIGIYYHVCVIPTLIINRSVNAAPPPWCQIWNLTINLLSDDWPLTPDPWSGWSSGPRSTDLCSTRGEHGEDLRSGYKLTAIYFEVDQELPRQGKRPLPTAPPSYPCRRRWWPAGPPWSGPGAASSSPSSGSSRGTCAPGTASRGSWSFHGNRTRRGPRSASASSPFPAAARTTGARRRPRRTAPRTAWRWWPTGTDGRVSATPLASRSS